MSLAPRPLPPGTALPPHQWPAVLRQASLERSGSHVPSPVPPQRVTGHGDGSARPSAPRQGLFDVTGGLARCWALCDRRQPSSPSARTCFLHKPPRQAFWDVLSLPAAFPSPYSILLVSCTGSYEILQKCLAASVPSSCSVAPLPAAGRLARRASGDDPWASAGRPLTNQASTRARAGAPALKPKAVGVLPRSLARRVRSTRITIFILRKICRRWNVDGVVDKHPLRAVRVGEALWPPCPTLPCRPSGCPHPSDGRSAGRLQCVPHAHGAHHGNAPGSRRVSAPIPVILLSARSRCRWLLVGHVVFVLPVPPTSSWPSPRPGTAMGICGL